ncbi:MAG: thermonuclease family protein [Spirochaetales bacterium]|nr:thermonuclease family protein [Spirochaetales bacterium]
MKRLLPLFLILIVLLFSCATKSAGEEPALAKEEERVAIDEDLTGKLKFNESSETVKTKVTVKSYIDGDTTHFFVPTSISEDGVLKARYIAINTPESTGKIEEWGKRASEFTKAKLSSAESIIIESDDGTWNLDSTGSRYLVWIWYRTSETEDYRCLNLEILEEGLALPSSSANNRYGSWCQNAIQKAKDNGLHVWSKEKDPDFFYGDALEVTTKELRFNPSLYDGKKVAFEGVITRNYNNSVYIESYDEETESSYGISVYYGYSLSGSGLEILQVGNRVRIVGTMQYYAAGGVYQISGLKYREMKKDDPGNIRLLEKGVSVEPRVIEPKELNGREVEVIVEDEVKSLPYSEALLGTVVKIDGITVDDVYVTTKEDSSSFGAMTLTCSKDGETITIRTLPFYEGGELMTERDFLGYVIDVTGVVDTYEGSVQIRVFNIDDITVY